MSIYKLFGNGTGGPQDSVSSLDVQFDGVITSIFGTMFADLDTDLDQIIAEASFLSSNTTSVNDSRGSLLILMAAASVTFGVVAVNQGVGPTEIPVSAGERIHLHINAATGVTSTVQFFMYVVDGAKPELRRRR